MCHQAKELKTFREGAYPNIIRLYGDCNPVFGSVLIITMIVHEATRDIDAPIQRTICAAFILGLTSI